jgi:hypothetical protein
VEVSVSRRRQGREHGRLPVDCEAGWQGSLALLIQGDRPAWRAGEDHDRQEYREHQRYRPTWEAWSAEYQRRSRIQTAYAELFRLHSQVQKQGELVELVLGLGLLSWRNPNDGKAASVFRHVVTARVDLHFDPATGVIQVDGAAEGAQLKIEDDMLDAELRPERGHYAVVGAQLGAIGDDVWASSR